MKLQIIILTFILLGILSIKPQKIYINSIPKCGTHLLMECVKKLTRRDVINTYKDVVTNNELPKLNNNSILVWHVKYSDKAYEVLKKNKFIGLFIYRDPRDQVASAAFWCIKNSFLLQNYGFTKENVNFNELLKKIILNVKKHYDSYLPWTKNDLFYSLKFEHLIGPKGGGDIIQQRQEIIKICNYLKIVPNYQLINNCIKNLFGNTVTFREGKIGSWKKYFTIEHKNLFKEIAGQLLIDLDYEKNFNW